MKITKQRIGSNWVDETGMEIPYARITKSEKLREIKAAQLVNGAMAVNSMLVSFKSQVAEACAAVVEAIRTENAIEADPKSKGNFTWYNFDRSIKIEVSINETIRFDEVLIDGAKELLMKLIDESITGDDFIKAIVADAFQTSAGKLDTKRVLGLKRHTERIKNAAIKTRWVEAMTLIDKSISRPESKSYQRIWLRNAAGEYDNIDLNFSSVK